jgi:hypothetical protein
MVPRVAGRVVLNGDPYAPAKGERLVLLLKDVRRNSSDEVPVGPDGTWTFAGISGGGIGAGEYKVCALLFGRPAGGRLFPGREPANAGAPVYVTLKRRLEVRPDGGEAVVELGEFE